MALPIYAPLPREKRSIGPAPLEFLFLTGIILAISIVIVYAYAAFHWYG